MKWQAFGAHDEKWRGEFYRMSAIRRCVNSYKKTDLWAYEMLTTRCKTLNAKLTIDSWRAAGDFNNI